MRVSSSTHHFMPVEPYSYTVGGERWVNPEWLSEPPYWFGYHAVGLVGYLFAWMMTCANLIFLYWRGLCVGSRRRCPMAHRARVSTDVGKLQPTHHSCGYIALSAELVILEAAGRKTPRSGSCRHCFSSRLTCTAAGLSALLCSCCTWCAVLRVDRGYQQAPFARDDRDRFLAVLGLSVGAVHQSLRVASHLESH